MGREKASYFFYFIFLFLFFFGGGGERGGSRLDQNTCNRLIDIRENFQLHIFDDCEVLNDRENLKKDIVGDVCHTKSIYVCQDTCQNQEPSNRLPLWPSRNFGRTCALSRWCGIYISIWIPCFTILILDVVLKKGLLVDNYWLPNDSVYSF